MPNLKTLAGAAALAILAACATATPYQAATDSNRGYSEQQIEANRFQVQFSGNTLTDRKTVETYLLYRAAELTREHGFDYFRVVRRDTDAESRLVPVGGRPYSPFYDHFYLDYIYYGPHAPYYRDPFLRSRYPYSWNVSPFGYYDPYWGGPAEYRERTSYEASAEILMGKGEKPDDAAFFDAEQVLFNLGNNILRPEPK
ncbi:hypothetical protein HY29_10080 [Hyphomonas beringensis]|uniref:Lipoprotein n=1 Tax=Hyphomonas beringensis TaxID=1280946 RepID=A0A062UH79_9PROT|nr:hypothetical protein [Hyphomonas beringensis]KCZ55944.1 hypothetical protein HY29_10080 [Hyphomonas beringensis]